MGINKVNNAIFWDRDGVILELIYHQESNNYGPAHSPNEVKFRNGIFEVMKKLNDYGFLFILISNQPDYAKGLVSMEKLKNVHDLVEKEIFRNKIIFAEFNYCYHHPDGIVPEYSVICECRKPGNKFIEDAVEKYNINRNGSFMIGDREKDIQCGKKSGLKTILVDSKQTDYSNFTEKPDYKIKQIDELINIIKK